MPGKEKITTEVIAAQLLDNYNLMVAQLVPVPYSADQHSRVFQADTPDGKSYFVKLRSDVFNPISVLLPHHLHKQGIEAVIPAIPANNDELWVEKIDYKLILYPHIRGLSAAEVDLTPLQWRTFGRTLSEIHRAVLPNNLRQRIPLQDYAPTWRRIVAEHLQGAETFDRNDPTVQGLAELLTRERDTILTLVNRAESLAHKLENALLPPVLCHRDIHEANLLVAQDGNIYLADWDDPILAPRECDLMFIGGGILGRWVEPQQADWFYQGYGRVDIDRRAIAYFRCERIVTDIAIFSNRILRGVESLEGRQTYMDFLQSNFDPGGTIDIALVRT